MFAKNVKICLSFTAMTHLAEGPRIRELLTLKVETSFICLVSTNTNNSNDGIKIFPLKILIKNN